MSKHNPPLERIARKGSNQTRRSVVRWIKRGLLAVGAGGIVAAIVLAMIPKPVAVDTAVATTGSLEVEIREDGQTRVRDRFVVAAPISGQLDRIELEAGAVVTAGTILARIEPPEPGLLDDRSRGEVTARLAAARVRERQATTAIDRAKVARDAAVREANRSRKLAEGGATSRSELERYELSEQLAIGDLAAAELARSAAAAEIAALRATLEPRDGGTHPLDVAAPISGRVLRVVRESAGPVLAGAPLLELGDPAKLEVVVDVLSRDAERIHPGMTVDIETAATQPLHGTIRVVEPSAFTRISALGVEEQRVNVIASVDSAASGLGDGYRVDARIVLWHGDSVLHVPTSALFRDAGAWAVYVVENGAAVVRRIEIGHRGRLDVEVTAGLTAGTEVIVHPSDRISAGVKVAPRR